MYSFSYLEPVHCSMSCSNCCFLTCIQISQEAGKMVWYSYLFKNFPQFVEIHTVKGIIVVNEADVFLELSCFFYDPADVGSLISGSSAFFKSSLYIWKFLVHVLLKPSLKDFEHYLASMWNERNCAVVWTFFGIALLWDWNENWKQIEDSSKVKNRLLYDPAVLLLGIYPNERKHQLEIIHVCPYVHCSIIYNMEAT